MRATDSGVVSAALLPGSAGNEGNEAALVARRAPRGAGGALGRGRTGSPRPDRPDQESGGWVCSPGGRCYRVEGGGRGGAPCSPENRRTAESCFADECVWGGGGAAQGWVWVLPHARALQRPGPESGPLSPALARFRKDQRVSRCSFRSQSAEEQR